MKHGNAALAVIGFALAVAYLPEMSGASVPPRYAVIGFAMVLLPFVPRAKLSWGHILGAMFLTWASLTFTWSPVSEYAQGALLIWLLLGGAFVLGASLDSLGGFWGGLALGVGVNSVVAVAQWGMNWQAITQMTPPPAGLFLNRNTLSDTGMLVLVATTFAPRVSPSNRNGFSAACLRWLLPILTLPALALSHSRSAMIALAAAFSLKLWTSHHRKTSLFVASITILTGAVLVILGYRSASAELHLNIALDTLQGLTFFGNGIGSYWPLFPKFATHIDTSAIGIDHAHSDLLEIMFELGTPGALLIFGLVIFCLFGHKERERLVLIAFCVDGLFAYPLYLPATGFIAALAAGHLCRNRAVVWGKLPDRGVELLIRLAIGLNRLRPRLASA